MNTSPTSVQPVLIDGQWRASQSTATFRATNPTTREALPENYPVSSWADCDTTLDAAVAAFDVLRRTSGEQLAQCLETFAALIETRVADLVAIAHAETALPAAPRLKDVELPRTTCQLRQAAAAARDGSWTHATIDTKAGIRSYLAPLGPVAVFGPNNFPFAFNSIVGGDFAAAIAAGNPVIAKANTSHPGTTRLLAELAQQAAATAGLPAGTVQLLYRTSHADGERLVADPRLQATGYTGARAAGLKLKAAADAAGRLFYAELSSVNPVVVLPGALRERLDDIANQFTASCLMAAGQFCTNPGLVVLLNGDATERFIERIRRHFAAAPVGTLLSGGVEQSLAAAIQTLTQAGAELLVGGKTGAGQGCSYANTLLRISGAQFLRAPVTMQTEAFGNASLLVVADDTVQAVQVLTHLEGNLTGCVYSDTQGSDDAAYESLAFVLRQRVGRLINDKMPTGVAVSPAMNHGGPYPATGHPHFTAVGIPAALRRFTILQCFDNVRPARLPAALQDKNPTGRMWRLVDGQWTQADVSHA